MFSNSLPSYKQALHLLRISGCNEALIKHVEAVSTYSVEVAKTRANVDIELVRIGGLLHDIGRCKTHGIDHGIVGAQLLQRYGIDERVVRIAQRHVGAGISADEAASLGLPPGIYIPQAVEEKIVAAVDNLIEDTRRVDIDHAEASLRRKLGDHPAIARVRSLHLEVFDQSDHSLDHPQKAKGKR